MTYKQQIYEQGQVEPPRSKVGGRCCRFCGKVLAWGRGGLVSWPIWRARGLREREMRRTPGFRTQASKYWVGTAPTGRAKCRTCKKSIEKGGVRLIALAFVSPGRSCKLVHHARCVTAKLAKAVLEVCGDVNRVPMSEDVDEQEQSVMRTRLLSLLK